MFPLLVMSLLVSCVLCAAGSSSSCEEARVKCAYRMGCGMALQNYMVGCSEVLHGPATSCPENCQHALIALTSTEEGQHLMTCTCGDEFCEETKQKVEICRPHVLLATRNETIVSCRIAQSICAADAECTAALGFYNRFCRAMFHGKKCTHRCNNSISILRRQEKAAKLDSCRCDGLEEYDCPRIRTNMARLCFHREEQEEEEEQPPPPTPPTSGVVMCTSSLVLIASLLMWLQVT